MVHSDVVIWHNLQSSRLTEKTYSLQPQLPLDELLELVRPSARGLDHFGFRVDQVVLDEVQACLDVGVFELDEMQASAHLLLHGYFIELIAGRLLRHTRHMFYLMHFMFSAQQLLAACLHTEGSRSAGGLISY